MEEKIGYKKKTQRQRILEYINEHGFITNLEATNQLFIMDLQGNIQALEHKGYKFDKEWCGNYKRYSLQERQQELVLSL